MKEASHQRGPETDKHPAIAPPAPGERVGPYEVICHLGRGGSANVFEARHVRLGTRVALKVHSIAGGSQSAIHHALREGRAVSALHHPNVVRTVDGGTHNGVPYVVMGLLEGEDLARRLAHRGSLPAQEAVDLLLPVISGVNAAHAAGLVHRDLKPSNIFLARRKLGIEPVIVDFGLSKFAEATEGAATSGIVGTPQYMAPEQLRGLRATPLSDQWSLAVVFYECITGGPPFWGQDRYELIHSVMTAPIPPPSEVNPEIPRGLDEIVLRALARSPEARFPRMRELGAALLPFGTEQARHRWTPEFVKGGHATDTLTHAGPSSESRLSRVDAEVRAPRFVRRSQAQGAFEIQSIGSVVHARLRGLWDVATGKEFLSTMLRVSRELSGRRWAILADSSQFPVQSPDVARLRQEVMANVRAVGCEKIAAVTTSASYAMQFKRIAMDSHVGSGVFSNEKAALNWIYDGRSRPREQTNALTGTAGD